MFINTQKKLAAIELLATMENLSILGLSDFYDRDKLIKIIAEKWNISEEDLKGEAFF